MRYAEGPGVGCEVFIEAPPQRVWELVTDIELPARLSPELQRVEWLDGAGGPALGARFAGHNHHPALGDWSTISHVVELDAQRAFAWAVMGADTRFAESSESSSEPMATWRFELRADSGGTRLRHSARLGPARSGLSLAIDRMPEKEEKIVANRLAEVRTGIEATLAGIKAAAEQVR